MAKQVQNANAQGRNFDLIADMGLSPDWTQFLREVSNADPKGFGYLVEHIYPTAKRHKEETGETADVYAIMRSDPDRWIKDDMNAEELHFDKATETPIYQWRNQMAQKYGPKGKVPAPPVVRVVRRVVDAILGATDGFSVGRRGRTSELEALRDRIPDSDQEAQELRERLTALDI